jgi:uncharacterized membrane protein YgdD (TMEM256/DUF423 family)
MNANALDGGDAGSMRLAALGAINALVAVAAGAFGAHALKERLDARRFDIFETAARYQMYHALGMIAAAWLASRGLAWAATGGWVMQAGVVVFSGSLYALALTDRRKLGAITPIGGVLFLAGWALLVIAAIRG